MTRKFEFLEHTADVYVAAYGSNLEEAFENSATAMFETMTDTKQVRASEEDRLEVIARDEEDLLYSWLEALLLKFEVDGRLYSRFKVESINSIPEGFILRAKMWGESYNRERHKSRTDVKAVTYHRMEILKTDSDLTVKFILDI